MTEHNYTSRVSNHFRDSGEKAKDKIDKMGDKLEDLENEVTTKGKELLEHSEKYKDKAVAYVKKHPLQSLAIASVAGIILGKIFRL